jgi:hypothetical protein
MKCNACLCTDVNVKGSVQVELVSYLCMNVVRYGMCSSVLHCNCRVRGS